MGGVEPWQVILGTLGSVAVAYLVYRGARVTAKSSEASATRATDQSSQDRALAAWEGLLQPLREERERDRKEIDLLRGELEQERADRAAQAEADAAERAEEKRLVQRKMDRLTERIDVLTIEVKHWKTMAKAIARWATALRDQVLTLGGTVPQIPDELLIAQLLDDDDSA